MYFLQNIDIQHVVLFLMIIAIVLLVHMLMFAYFTAKPPDLTRFESEKFFAKPANDTKQRFPDIKDPPSINLSVIVPAYNEEDRLSLMMDEALEHLESRKKEDPRFTYEIIVVDDGSRDKTTQVALKYSVKHGTEKVRVLTQEVNRGKGGAVKMGILSSRGELMLFADADGATRFCDVTKLEACMAKVAKNHHGIVCGSRAHLEKESIAERSMFRTVLMKGFHLLVWALCVRSVNDTQCGFKLFTRRTAQLLFHNLHVQRWAFDVDLLYQAEYHSIPIGEVAVKWQEIDGSKITPFWSWLEMGRDLMLVSARYTLGAWKLQPKLKSS